MNSYSSRLNTYEMCMEFFRLDLTCENPSSPAFVVRWHDHKIFHQRRNDQGTKSKHWRQSKDRKEEPWPTRRFPQDAQKWSTHTFRVRPLITTCTNKMADVREAFPLCKVFHKDSLVGIERHIQEDVIVLTFTDRGVLVYNVSICCVDFPSRVLL